MDKHILDEIASSLIALVGALRLYPPGHPAVKGPLSRFLDASRPYIFEKNHLLIRFYEDLIVVEGEPAYDLAAQSEEVCRFFKEKGIEGFELHRGIQESDVVTFLQTLLTTDAPPEKIPEILQAQNIHRITPVSFHKEEDISRKARRIYREAKKFIIDIMSETKTGKTPKSGEKAVEMMEEIGDIMDQDINAVLPLVILQDYDEYTFNHCVNVGILSLALAKAVEMPVEEAIAIGVGGMLHDIGKTKVPKNILLKTSKLTTEEWELLKAHPVFGAQIAKEMGSLDAYTIRVIYQHHVGLNLKGYPQLKNPDELVRGAIIVATCDNYDAMTTQRPYQMRMDPSQALKIMEKKVGSFLDPFIFSRFVQMMGKYPLGSIVRLDTSEVGVVSRVNLKEPDLPYVKIIMDSHGNKLDKPYEVNTADRDPATGQLRRRIVDFVDPLTRGLIEVTHYFSLEEG